VVIWYLGQSTHLVGRRAMSLRVPSPCLDLGPSSSFADSLRFLQSHLLPGRGGGAGERHRRPISLGQISPHTSLSAQTDHPLALCSSGSEEQQHHKVRAEANSLYPAATTKQPPPPVCVRAAPPTPAGSQQILAKTPRKSHSWGEARPPTPAVPVLC